MKKNLLIVESPAKSKTISKFLGKNYKVIASKGHVRDLPKSKFGVDIENNFNPSYISIRGKGDIIKELKAEAKKADRILLATDPDREGEAISWHLAQILNIPEGEACRVEFNEITKDAVQNSIKHPRPLNGNKINAQQARRILDRIVGYKLSPLLWRKIRKGLSAGRVQSAALRLVCDREDEINSFIPEEYWTIIARLKKEGEKQIFESKLFSHMGTKLEIRTEAECTDILTACKKASFKVASLKTAEKRRMPSAPFTTSTMQQEAARKLNFNSKKTMSVAQQLYEGLDIGKHGTIGLVTYIRTDSTRISAQASSEAQEYIVANYGKEFYPEKTNVFVTKQKSQDAHEAIRPTYISIRPEDARPFLSNEQFKLYKLIWERFVSSQMKYALYDTQTVDISAGDYMFRSTGSRVKFPGFTVLYVEGNDDSEQEKDSMLPAMEAGDILHAEALNDKQHFTQPPPRYTEAALVKALEERDIGRPSTYAPIIETLVLRNYVRREQKKFYPTELGHLVIQMLKEHFPDIINIEFTAGMEEKLDMISEGSMKWQQVLADFYDSFSVFLAEADSKIEAVEIEPEVTDVICEKCGRNMVVRHGRFGDFLACPGYPECRNTKAIQHEIGVKCPNCEKGDIIERKTKKGRNFYGCSTYPDCNFVLWDKPTGEKCPHCGSLIVEKHVRGQVEKLCSNKDCVVYADKVKKTEGKKK